MYFVEIYVFCRNIRILSKITYFVENYVFCRKLRILSKITSNRKIVEKTFPVEIPFVKNYVKLIGDQCKHIFMT